MMKILLVDDNEMSRDMLSRRLARRGLDVVVAEDGQTAIDRASEIGPDIILMDLSLPVLDGWTATRLLKSSSETKHIPVIALTAHAMTEDEARARDAGCDDFDTKPVDLDRLLAKMDALMRVRDEHPSLT